MKKQGFTLIELLVVISIISLLSSIVLSSLSNARMKARDIKRMSDLHQIQLALEMYRDDNGGKYPSINTTPNADSCPSCTYYNNWLILETKLNPYISKLPIDPINNGRITTLDNYSYYYRSGLAGGACAFNDCYDLITRLEDPNSPYRCDIKQYINNSSNVTLCPIPNSVTSGWYSISTK